jgi:hypothetical protein
MLRERLQAWHAGVHKVDQQCARRGGARRDRIEPLHFTMA